jgi:hypothetical protein
MREPRLGDDIDDYCVRCKRIMNHAIVSVVNAEPAKVRCRTCHSDHDYRHELPPPPKVDARKQALFTEVLKKVSPADAEAAAEIDPEIAADEEVLEGEGEAEVEAESAEEAEAVAAEADPPAEEPKPKKGKAKATSRRK